MGNDPIDVDDRFRDCRQGLRQRELLCRDGKLGDDHPGSFKAPFI
jgi:hypothetical protein